MHAFACSFSWGHFICVFGMYSCLLLSLKKFHLLSIQTCI